MPLSIQQLRWREAPFPTGETGNSGLHCDVLRRLRENVRRRRPELWRKQQTRLLHHDNAPSHTSVLTQQFMANYEMTVIPHPPHSPDLAPCDFFLFPKMKLKLKGRRFMLLRRSRPNRRECLTLIEKDFQEAFQKWRWRYRCLHAGGNYYECDGGRQALMLSFMIFTASVRNILNSSS
jgi:transposase